MIRYYVSTLLQRFGSGLPGTVSDVVACVSIAHDQVESVIGRACGVYLLCIPCRRFGAGQILADKIAARWRIRNNPGRIAVIGQKGKPALTSDSQPASFAQAIYDGDDARQIGTRRCG